MVDRGLGSGRLAGIMSLQQRAAEVHRAAIALQFREEERLLAVQIRSLNCRIEQLRLLRDEIQAVSGHVEQISLGINVHTPTIASLRTQTGQIDRLAAPVAGSAEAIRQHLASLRSARMQPAGQPGSGTATVGGASQLGRTRDWARTLRAAFSELVDLDDEPPRDTGAIRPMPPPLGATEAIRASRSELRPVALAMALADDCAICIDGMRAGQSAVTLPCGHAFHGCCILQWLVTGSASCPLCKRSVCSTGGPPAASAFLVSASQYSSAVSVSREHLGPPPALAAAPRSSSAVIRVRRRRNAGSRHAEASTTQTDGPALSPWLIDGSGATDGGEGGWAGPGMSGRRLAEAVARLLRAGHDEVIGAANRRRGG
jgi:hypothetical protein